MDTVLSQNPTVAISPSPHQAFESSSRLEAAASPVISSSVMPLVSVQVTTDPISDGHKPAPVPTTDAPFKARIPVEDVLALREFLRQVDLRHYGFTRDDPSATDPSAIDRKAGASTPIRSNGRSSVFLNSPRGEARIRAAAIDGEQYSSSGHEDDAEFSHSRLPSMSSMFRAQSSSPHGVSVVPSSPLNIPASSASSIMMRATSVSGGLGLMSFSSPIRRSTPSSSSSHVPYKGKFGVNPKCASCQTTKTPYWRDAWNQGILLCNACGLRFAKFKRRCTQCHYVPRKEDKGGRCCPSCRGPWTQ